MGALEYFYICRTYICPLGAYYTYNYRHKYLLQYLYHKVPIHIPKGTLTDPYKYIF